MSISNGCLYNAQNGKWTCQGDFQFRYVFPVCGMYKKDGGTFQSIYIYIGTSAFNGIFSQKHEFSWVPE